MRRSSRSGGGIAAASASVRAVVRSLGARSAKPVSVAGNPPFSMPRLRPPVFADRTVDIRDHGAVGDDLTDCSTAIANAVDACADAGGGRVLVPAGTWLTGPIHLRSNIELHLAANAVVRFSNDPRRYLPPVFVRWCGQECYNYSPLIYARDCQNIAITGSGALLGQGSPWWSWHKPEQRTCAELYQMVLQGVPVEQRIFGSELRPLRPQFILLINCRSVLLEDFTIGEGGPFWTVHLAYCRNVITRRLRVLAPDGPDNDGIVIDSTRDALIEDCELQTSDDCIALKSGMNEDGWHVGRPTENVIVRRIRATKGRGGITIGSDMSGGVRNVLVHDCRFDGLGAGIRMKAARGRGGVVEDVFIQGVSMRRIRGDAIQLTTEYPSFVKPDGKAPIFRNIRICDVACEDARAAVRMFGLSEAPVQDISLENVTITADEGLVCAAGNGIRLVNVKITPRSGPVLSVKNSQEVLIQGLNNANGASVFLDLRGRHTRNIRLRGEANQSSRPAVVLGIDVPRDAVVHE